MTRTVDAGGSLSGDAKRTRGALDLSAPDVQAAEGPPRVAERAPGLDRSESVSVCRFVGIGRAACARPAVGICTLCGDTVCAEHAGRGVHFNVRRFS